MGVKSLVQGLNAAATAGFEPRTVDLKSDAVTDWPLRLLLITMVKETVILYKKEFRKMKKSRISP